MIELNQTLFFQVIGYFILFLILNRFLYKPLLKIFKEREELTTGTLKKVSDIERGIEEGLVSYDKRIKEAAVKGQEERNKLRAEALEREKALLEEARNQAAGELSRMRAELEKSRKEAVEGLRAETKTLSKSIAEKILERNVTIAVIAFLVPLLPLIAHAAEEGEHGGDTMSFVWKVVNFTILAIAIIVIWKKGGVGSLLDKRRDGIKKAIEDAKAARENAERSEAEYRQKLATLEKRVSEIHEELRLEGQAEKERMMKDAAAASERIKEQARLAADQEIKKARIEIRKEVGELAVEMAQEILKKELKPEDQERLVKNYLKDLRLN